MRLDGAGGQQEKCCGAGAHAKKAARISTLTGGGLGLAKILSNAEQSVVDTHQPVLEAELRLRVPGATGGITQRLRLDGAVRRRPAAAHGRRLAHRLAADGCAAVGYGRECEIGGARWSGRHIRGCLRFALDCSNTRKTAVAWHQLRSSRHSKLPVSLALTATLTWVAAGGIGVGERRLGQVRGALPQGSTLLVAQRRVRQRAGPVRIPAPK